jgi:preprotein translocase subunit YajC
MTSVSDSLLILAQTAPAGAPGGGFNPSLILVYVFVFGAFWFLMIAPQKKKQKEHAKMLAALDTGDEIITVGGIYGEITNKKEDRYTLQIASGVKVEIGKSFVHDVVRKDGNVKK